MNTGNDRISLRQLVLNLLQAYEALQPYGICSLSDFAEFLFERALLGTRERRGKKGFDVLAPMYGRVQVKYRQLPSDGRIEQRLHCGNMDSDSFDYLGAVIFNTDFSIKSGLLISRAAVWATIDACQDREKKIPYQSIASLGGAIDLTNRLRRALAELD